MIEANPLATGINGAILAHIAIETAPYTVLRYGIRELKARIADEIARLEVVVSSGLATTSHQPFCEEGRQRWLNLNAKIDKLKSVIAHLQHRMDTTSPNDHDKVHAVAVMAQSAFLLLQDLENTAQQVAIQTASRPSLHTA